MVIFFAAAKLRKILDIVKFSCDFFHFWGLKGSFYQSVYLFLQFFTRFLIVFLSVHIKCLPLHTILKICPSEDIKYSF